jgi:hydrophobe/amphiphile efflux-3 (HAE3) family protein
VRRLARGDFFGGVVRAVARRPAIVLIVVGVLALAGVGLSLRLDPSASTDTLVDRSSDAFRATERFREQFGEEPVVILAKGNLQNTVLTQDLLRLLSLEGCISGRAPRRADLSNLPPVCGEFHELKPAKAVYGPGTFISTAAGQITQGFSSQSRASERQAAEASRTALLLARRAGYSKARQRRLASEARDLVRAKFTEDTIKLALRYGLTSLPALDNPSFVSSVVFRPGRVNSPKPRFAYLFPSGNAALIQVRLRPDLSEAERERAIDLIRTAVAEEQFKPKRGARYVLSGVPVVVDALASEVQRSIFVLLGAALLVMAATLALVFRTRMRLLPLALALAAAALTFGAVSLAGGGLTMASIAALPVLIGLAVDYAIQFQARFDEVHRPGRDAVQAAPLAASVGGPTIATAGLSTGVGFLVLLLSPVPMVRGFGAVLVAGIALAFACALTAGFAALVRYGDGPRPGVPPVLPRARDRVRRAAWSVADSRAGMRIADSAQRWGEFLARVSRSALELAMRRPRKVLAIALAVAVAGWLADTQTDVVSDVRELVPRDLQALEDVNELQRATGVSGEIDVTVRAEDLTEPSVIRWMTTFQQEVLGAHGYRPNSTCAQRRNAPELCPALSLPDLFRSVAPTKEGIRALLDAVPPYFSQAVISPDRKTATLAFGIRLMPLDRQQRVIDDVERRLDPPRGVEASVAGLPVLAAEANGALSSTGRRMLTLLAGLAGVFLVLLAVRRRVRLAAVPLIPIALATGWSALVLYVLQIPLNPMSATMAALVIAISTEFSVLLSSRYRLERAGGLAPRGAIERTYASTGAAVLASGTTAIAGFAALIASDIRMLRDFGVVTVVDLTVSLLGVMVVLPAALVWAEEHGPFTVRDLDPRRLGPVLGGGVAALRTRRPSLAGLSRLRVRQRPRLRLPQRPRLPWRRA